MSSLFTQRFDALWVEEPITYDALTVFPLSGVCHGDVRYTLLHDALAAKTVRLAELDSPRVNSLRAINAGDLPVFIPDGAELVGGWQNRSAAASFLIPPGTTVIPVICVEQGRWDTPVPTFAAPDISYLSLRAEQSLGIHHALSTSGTLAPDHSLQSRVWSALAAAQKAENVSSPSGAMRDIYTHREDDLRAFTQAIPYVPGSVGMVIAIGNRIRALELFDAPGTLQALWERLIRSAAIDAKTATPGAPVTIDRAIRMVHRVRDAKVTAFRSPGLGHDVRITGGGIAGAALLYQAVVVHAALFRQDTP
jgi:hypothetical protein